MYRFGMFAESVGVEEYAKGGLDVVYYLVVRNEIEKQLFSFVANNIRIANYIEDEYRILHNDQSRVMLIAIDKINQTSFGSLRIGGYLPLVDILRNDVLIGKCVEDLVQCYRTYSSTDSDINNLRKMLDVWDVAIRHSVLEQKMYGKEQTYVILRKKGRHYWNIVKDCFLTAVKDMDFDKSIIKEIEKELKTKPEVYC
jgi:hypothetical protein